MKKAIIEQFLLGFVLILASLLFVATVGDEISVRNKANNIQKLAFQTAKTMAIAYNQTSNMCWSRTQAQNLLLETNLGRELLALERNNPNNFTYEYYDFLPINDDGTVGDNQPDQVRVSVSNYSHQNFWYKFFDKDSFTIPQITKQFAVSAPMSLSIDFGGGVTRGNGMIGIYQLDQNNCVTNTTVLMEGQNKYTTGESLIKDLPSPPNYFFIIPDGGNNFPDAQKGNKITLSPQHCESTGTSDNRHNISIGAVNKNSQKVYFQHNSLNSDNDTFVQAIPANVWDLYNNYVEPAEGKRSTLTKFLNYCKTEAFQEDIKAINEDGDKSNDIIDCVTDLNGQYKYGFEDWDKGDDDYNDVFINGTQFIVPNSQDNYSVDPNTRQVLFDDDYCETAPLNTPPTLNIEGCPITMDEDTSINIAWNANDSDGTIESSSVMAQNSASTVTINGNSANTQGTVFYQPEENYYGNDIIHVLVTDNEGAIARRECEISIVDVNDPPTITGAAITSIKPNENYSFTPLAEDVDNDVLTFSIQNKPSWLSFDTNSGELSGVASNADIGVYSNIIISVSDGRGGTAQLPNFNIEVTNAAPVLGSPIPDQEVKVYEIFAYNVSPHFSDPNNDALSYTIKATIDGNPINWLNISADGQITSIKIPSGYTGKNIVVTVSASDGKASVSDTFNILIKSNNNVPIYTHNFNVNKENWEPSRYTQRVLYKGSHRLKVKYNRFIRNTRTFWASNTTYNFGVAQGNMDVEVTFKLHHVGNWGAGNSFKIGMPNGFSQTYTFNNTGGPIDITTTGRTLSNGRFYLLLQLQINNINNYIYVDDMKIQLK